MDILEKANELISDKDKGYFAAMDAESCVAVLEEKHDSWNKTLESLGYWDKLRDMYAAWHSAYNSSVGEAHQITFSGDDGEYVELVANHLRNIGRHMHTMVTSVRPAMEARAANTDYKSQVQTKLANGLLDYYMRARRDNLEERMKLACEYAIALGCGWIKMSWNPNGGGISNAKEIQDAKMRSQIDESIEIPEPEYQGDVELVNLSPFDVFEDLSKEDIRHDWQVARSFKNRYDLIKVYPDLADELMKIDAKSDKLELGNLSLNSLFGGSDDIPIFEFYHAKSESIPEGRYILYCNSKTVLYDGPLPYREIPLYSIKPSRILGTPLGYSDMFDLLPLQDAVNMLHSTILTNQAAFGVQTILNPSTSNIDPSQISQGLAILNYNPQGGKPEALQLTSTPPEIFNYLNMLVQTEETISGINSVVRGNPEANLRSGSAIAMIQSNSIQYLSGLQSQYIHLIEDIGLGLINMLIDFADSPRIADIIGESGKNYIQTFKGEDLRDINRVIVDAANPLTKTIAGRVQMADNLLQYGQITPKQYMNVIQTGNLETATDSIINEEMAIKKENEALLAGQEVLVFPLELHDEHIKGHRAVISDPVMKSEPNLVKNVLAHIQEHINAWRNMPQDLMLALGIPPLQAPSTPTNQPTPPQGPMGQPNPAAQPPVEQAVEMQGATPQNIRLPEGFEDVPLTPEANMERIGG